MAHISTCGSSLGPLCWPCSVAQMSSSTLRPGPQQWKSRCVDPQGAPPPLLRGFPHSTPSTGGPVLVLFSVS